MIVYILYSKKLDRYYVGSTDKDFETRLAKHNSAYYTSKSYTAKANDWSEKLILNCQNLEQMRKIERQIKKMKSRKYIEKLINMEEVREQLLNKY